MRGRRRSRRSRRRSSRRMERIIAALARNVALIVFSLHWTKIKY